MESENTTGLDTKSIEEMAENIREISDKLSNIPETEEDAAYLITEEMKNEELEKIRGLNYIELLQYKRELQQKKQELIQTKEAIEQLTQIQEQLKNVDEEAAQMGEKLAMENIEDDVDLNSGEFSTFLDNFDSSMKYIEETINATQDRIKEFDETEKTSSFMNKNMIEIVNKRLAALENQPRYKKMVIYYRNIKGIYEDRTSVKWILESANNKEIEIRRWKEANTKEKKLGKRDLIETTKKQVSRAFTGVFNISQLKIFEQYLKDVLQRADDPKDVSEIDRIVFQTQYILYLLYTDRKARERGFFKWVESFIINILDVKDNHFDLIPVEELDDKIYKVLCCLGSM